MPVRRTYKIVEVEWFDAQTSTESLYVEEIAEKLKPLWSRSIGYLVDEKEDYIVLGFLLFGNDLVKHHQVIPRGMIKKIHKVGSITLRRLE